MLSFIVTLIAFQNPDFTKSQEKAVADIRKVGGNVAWVRENDVQVLCVDYQKKVPNLDLEPLTRLPKVYAVRILQGDVSTDSLRNLKRLPNLGLLVVHGKGVDDDGLRVIGALNQLDKLDVRGDTITAKGLSHLKNLKKLRRLFLYGTKIQGVDALADLIWLNQIDLPETVPQSSLEKLRKRLPRTVID